MTREDSIQRLKAQALDLLVIGGGATGTGVALDAAVRGLAVGLVEGDDFASGTSSRSTKLVHGGVRYLELAVKHMDRGQYKLVREALHERATLLRIAPHLVHPIALVTPVYGWLEAPYYMAGLRLYDWIAGRSGLEKSHYLNAPEALRRFPMLKKEGLRGGVVYFDGQFNDARMNVTLALTAAREGALVANHVSVEALVKHEGRLVGARVRDELTQETWDVRARVVVNATGPFVDAVRRMDDPEAPPLLKASSGTHIVLDRRFAPPDTGLLIPKTEDGRVVFLLPWLGHTLVGTTDNPAPIEVNPAATEEDVDYLLRQLAKYFSLTVTRDDILAAWCGLRPLVCDPKASDTAGISRDHTVNVSPSGLVTITGGKWTTYRRMASDTVEHAMKIAGLRARRAGSTRTTPLVGAEGYGPEVAVKLEAAYGLSPEVALHLAEAYGDRAFRVAELAKAGLAKPLVPGHPYLEAEVVYGARAECARAAVDILARRTRLAFLDARATLVALPRVIALLAAELGWDDSRQKKEERAVRDYLHA